MKLGLSLCGRTEIEADPDKVQSKTFGPMVDKLTNNWRKIHNEELYNLCSSSNIVDVIEPRRMR